MSQSIRNLRLLAAHMGVSVPELIRRRASHLTGNAVAYVDADQTVRLSKPDNFALPDTWAKKIRSNLEKML